MRFPSLFRLPKHQQFEIKPRYYDPVKEFIKEREEMAKKGELKEGESPSRIRFERRKSSKGMNASLLQLFIALGLSGLIVGWLYLGDDIVYVLLLVVPAYLYVRLRRR